jgi:hypothetical protein
VKRSTTQYVNGLRSYSPTLTLPDWPEEHLTKRWLMLEALTVFQARTSPSTLKQATSLGRQIFRSLPTWLKAAISIHLSSYGHDSKLPVASMGKQQ